MKCAANCSGTIHRRRGTSGILCASVFFSQLLCFIADAATIVPWKSIVDDEDDNYRLMLIRRFIWISIPIAIRFRVSNKNNNFRTRVTFFHNVEASSNPDQNYWGESALGYGSFLFKWETATQLRAFFFCNQPRLHLSIFLLEFLYNRKDHDDDDWWLCCVAYYIYIVFFQP